MDAFQRYSTTSSGAAMGDPGQGSTSTSNGGGGGRRRRSREIETLSVEIRKYPKDLFHSFLSTEPIKAQNRLNRSASEEQEDGGIELNLGLSLGGRFGVDKSNGGLIRASSIAGTVPTFREVQESSAPAAVNAAALARTASLPVETEEEWRRRKEMQTLRRMEAKRRRSEKQMSIKEKNSNGAGEERERQQLGLGLPGKLNRNPGPGPGHGLAGHWGGCSRQGSGGFEAAGVKGKGGFFGSLQGLLAKQVPQQQLQGCSQGSGDSYGGCSSGVSELESKTHQGSGSCGEARSSASTHSTQERGSQELSPVGSSSSTKYAEGSTSKHPETPDHKKKDAAAAAPGGIEDMPCVFTIGDGPNGRKVEGILYKYGKGEEVRIMCICHGSFFSPTEFVKHAGGCDVEHPLRHIVVNPSPSAF